MHQKDAVALHVLAKLQIDGPIKRVGADNNTAHTVSNEY